MVHKILFRGHRTNCDCVTFRALKSFPLYTSHCHMILSKQNCCLLLTGVSTVSKTYLCTSDKAGCFSNRKYDSYKFWTCTELQCEAFTFLMENIYVRFEGIVGIPMGTNCSPLFADLFYLSIESHFVGVHGPYELHRKEEQIKCTA